MADPLHQGVTVRSLEEQAAEKFRIASQAISSFDIERALGRLRRSGQVTMSSVGGSDRYALSPEARADLTSTEEDGQSRFGDVVTRLFRDAPGGPQAYTAAFFECLCSIFLSLAETYVRVLRRDTKPDEMVTGPSLTESVSVAASRHPEIEPSAFRGAVVTFFSEVDPQYDELKWMLAQSHYMLLALGLDPGGSLLSQELFSNALVYLDTNVVVEALEPSARTHLAFKTLCGACRKLGIDVKVCQVSLDELERTVAYYSDLIPRVIEQIPEATAPHVRGIFFHLYRQELLERGTVDVGQLFSRFDRARDRLRDEFSVEWVDDPWFAQQEQVPGTQKVIARIQRVREERHLRPKSKGSARHDAMMLRYVAEHASATDRSVLLVTLDHSLPFCRVADGKAADRSVAITLDALIQWLAPVAIGTGPNVDAAAAFAEAVRYQLLPQEQVFDLKDFLVFAEMGYSCKDLPREDVENCIRRIKSVAPTLDPSSPADREKLAHEVARFLADPGRRYRKDTAHLRAELVRTETEATREIAKRDERIRELEETARRREREQLRQSAKHRLAVVAAGVVVTLLALLWHVNRYGDGSNLLQKAANSWPLLISPGVAGLVVVWFALGKERIEVLGWSWRKLLNSEESQPDTKA
jgi:hypothetical protein